MDAIDRAAAAIAAPPPTIHLEVPLHDGRTAVVELPSPCSSTHMLEVVTGLSSWWLRQSMAEQTRRPEAAKLGALGLVPVARS